MEEGEPNLGVFLLSVVLIVPTLVRIPLEIIRPFGIFHRSYSVTDNRYVMSKIPFPLTGPIWTNDADLYLLAGWPVPGNDFYNTAEVPGSVIDWTQPPFDSVQTRIELLPTATTMGREPKNVPGWITIKEMPLTRGKWNKLRIRTRVRGQNEL